MDISAYIMPSIAAICYILAEVFKKIVVNDRMQDFIPLGCLVVGTALAIWMALYQQQAITVETILGGMASGLAATGAYELWTCAKGGASEGKHARED